MSPRRLFGLNWRGFTTIPSQPAPVEIFPPCDAVLLAKLVGHINNPVWVARKAPDRMCRVALAFHVPHMVFVRMNRSFTRQKVKGREL